MNKQGSFLDSIWKILNSPRTVKDGSNEPKVLGEILNEQIKTGLEEYKRPSRSLFFSTFAAGMEIGFSLFVLDIVYNLLSEDISEAGLQFALAFSYPPGVLVLS